MRENPFSSEKKSGHCYTQERVKFHSHKVLKRVVTVTLRKRFNVTIQNTWLSIEPRSVESVYNFLCYLDYISMPQRLVDNWSCTYSLRYVWLWVRTACAEWKQVEMSETSGNIQPAYRYWAENGLTLSASETAELKLTQTGMLYHSILSESSFTLNE